MAATTHEEQTGPESHMGSGEGAGGQAPTTDQPRSVAGGPAYTDAELRHAFQAFKKRLKLSKLDQESHLGGGRPMTAGKKSDIQQIMPPNQFPREIWKELAARKQIKDHGGGFYSLP